MIYDDDKSGLGYGTVLDKIVRGYVNECYETALLDMGGVSVNKTEDIVFNRSHWVRGRLKGNISFESIRSTAGHSYDLWERDFSGAYSL